MSEATSELQIGAPGVDTDQIVREIRETVARREARGDYQDLRIARAERHNLATLQDNDDFARFYLDCLRHAVTVDINDFEIVEKRARLAPLLVRLKRGIWSLLRFYTYRLWSQQNETNALLLSAMESLDERQRRRLADLEARLARLEGRANAPGTETPPS